MAGSGPEQNSRDGKSLWWTC